MLLNSHIASAVLELLLLYFHTSFADLELLLLYFHIASSDLKCLLLTSILFLQIWGYCYLTPTLLLQIWNYCYFTSTLLLQISIYYYFTSTDLDLWLQLTKSHSMSPSSSSSSRSRSRPACPRQWPRPPPQHQLCPQALGLPRSRRSSQRGAAQPCPGRSWWRSWASWPVPRRSTKRKGIGSNTGLGVTGGTRHSRWLSRRYKQQIGELMMVWVCADAFSRNVCLIIHQ